MKNGVSGCAQKMQSPWLLKLPDVLQQKGPFRASTKLIGNQVSTTASVAMPSCLTQAPSLMQVVVGHLSIRPQSMKLFSKK